MRLEDELQKTLLGEELYAKLSSIREDLFSLRIEIEKHLKSNPWKEVIEEQRGGSLLVDELGEVHLSSEKKRALPSLKALRQLAEDQGVNISDLGRKKKDIMKRLIQKDEKGTATVVAPIPLKKPKKQQEVERDGVISPPHLNTEDRELPKDDFDFLDEIDETPELEIPENNEEQRLLEQVLKLSSRGGKLQSFANSVDLDKILND